MPVIVQHSRTSSTSSNFASPQPPAPPAYHDLQRQFNGCQINASLFVPEESQGGDVEQREVDDEGDEERVMGTVGFYAMHPESDHHHSRQQSASETAMSTGETTGNSFTTEIRNLVRTTLAPDPDIKTYKEDNSQMTISSTGSNFVQEIARAFAEKFD